MMQNTIKKHLLYFCIPAIVVFTIGLVVSGWDGYDGLVETLWSLLTRKMGLEELSSSNVFGLFLFVIGLTIAIVSARTLREFYASTLLIREGHQLITRGPYRFLWGRLSGVHTRDERTDPLYLLADRWWLMFPATTADNGTV